ncbi:Response regulator [uncultured Pleomorphomonas sp.]|uniref:Response regulator n=1 Tax=uncultured Pleomorphomonas sp. TaxID=442121 RepID=A0A212L343_9HYPH|nr:response regulator [uncultured Pleomorphomonas sp.]SCM71981.1 Response regulator [uncultured Pleomorphomonas sp.]
MAGGKRILILEDEPLIAMDLEDLLIANGHTVIGPYATADDAINSLDRTQPETALLDVYLFNGLSFGVARELKQRGIRFAFMTGLVMTDLLPADLRGSPIILKPYNEKELLAFVADGTSEKSPC